MSNIIIPQSIVNRKQHRSFSLVGLVLTRMGTATITGAINPIIGHATPVTCADVPATDINGPVINSNAFPIEATPPIIYA
jgi:hypothetical protein